MTSLDARDYLKKESFFLGGSDLTDQSNEPAFVKLYTTYAQSNEHGFAVAASTMETSLGEFPHYNPPAAMDFLERLSASEATEVRMLAGRVALSDILMPSPKLDKDRAAALVAGLLRNTEPPSDFHDKVKSDLIARATPAIGIERIQMIVDAYTESRVQAAGAEKQG